MIRPRIFAAIVIPLIAGLLCLLQAQAQMGPLTGANTPFTKTSRGTYTAQGVNFDGATYFDRGAALTGNAASKVGIVSFWFQVTSPDAFNVLLEDPTFAAISGLQLLRQNTN